MRLNVFAAMELSAFSYTIDHCIANTMITAFVGITRRTEGWKKRNPQGGMEVIVYLCRLKKGRSQIVEFNRAKA